MGTRHRSSSIYSIEMASLEVLMREFLVADKNKSGFVSEKEAEDYFKKKGAKPAEITDFMKKFDKDKDGKISLAEFARALGGNMADYKAMQAEFLEDEEGKGPALSPDIEVFASSMPKKTQKRITEEFKRLVDQQKSINDITNEVHEFVEKDMG